jgi:hypothetical protein
MLNATYFKEQLNKQVRELGEGCCTVKVCWTDGAVFNVLGIEPDSA